MDTLGIYKVIFVSHSLGVFVTNYYALMYPERTLGTIYLGGLGISM